MPRTVVALSELKVHMANKVKPAVDGKITWNQVVFFHCIQALAIPNCYSWDELWLALWKRHLQTRADATVAEIAELKRLLDVRNNPLIQTLFGWRIFGRPVSKKELAAEPELADHMAIIRKSYKKWQQTHFRVHG